MTRGVGLAKLASVVLLTAALAACERSTTAPAAPAMAPRLDGVGHKSEQLEAPNHHGGKTSAYVGRKGGRLHFDDASAPGVEYWLDVPPGSVDGSTLFTMQVLPGRNYEVVLTASAGRTDVGKKGFKEQVRLTISYSSAKHPAPPGHLLVAWLPDDGGAPVPVKTQVNPGQKTITGFLPHFSKYGVIF